MSVSFTAPGYQALGVVELAAELSDCKEQQLNSMLGQRPTASVVPLIPVLK